jgi:hypothetical protein
MMRKESRQDDGHEIDQEMADDVRDQVATPEIDDRQNCPEGENDVGPAIGPMREADDGQKRDGFKTSCPLSWRAELKRRLGGARLRAP